MMSSGCECLGLLVLLLPLTSVSTLERFEVLGPAGPIVAIAGEDVVLPCHLKPNMSAVDLRVEWFRVQTNNPVVHLYKEREDRNENQVPSYRGRTSLFLEELKKGNSSLKLLQVRGSDHGRYKCFVQSPEWYEDSSITVHIKAIGTQPAISTEGYRGGGISLLCESQGWYPEPALVWLDSDGRSLPAEPTATHTDSMDLFTVRKQVIVQERDTNRFTCQVLLLQYNEMKETLINIPGEMFHRAHPWKVTFAVFVSLAAAGLIGCSVLLHLFLKLRTKKGQLKKQHGQLTEQYELLKAQSYAADVTLDPDTAHPRLILSEDRKQVRYGETKQDLPDNPERIDWWPCVLGEGGFSSGRHYWEVQVGEKTDWRLGVARESVNRKECVTLNPANGLWLIWLRNGNEYKALSDPIVSLRLTVNPQKMAVYVDYDGGQVSFYSVENKSHIYTFTGCHFTERLYPFFWPGFDSSPLVISPLRHTD